MMGVSMMRSDAWDAVGTPDYMPEVTSCVYGHAPMISSHDTQLDMDIIVSMFIQIPNTSHTNIIVLHGLIGLE